MTTAQSLKTGAVTEFLASALRAGISWSKPDATLDYAEVLVKLNKEGRYSFHIHGEIGS